MKKRKKAEDSDCVLEEHDRRNHFKRRPSVGTRLVRRLTLASLRQHMMIINGDFAGLVASTLHVDGGRPNNMLSSISEFLVSHQVGQWDAQVLRDLWRGEKPCTDGRTVTCRWTNGHTATCQRRREWVWFRDITTPFVMSMIPSSPTSECRSRLCTSVALKSVTCADSWTFGRGAGQCAAARTSS